jgi:TetR/AcrR family transcriptional repressor of nem operon
MPKGEETRARIVAKAANLFNQHGFEGSSMAALMEATGLEKGGIYRHFSSKEELAAEAFDYAWNAATEARMYKLDSIANRADRLKQFVANFVGRRPAIAGGCPLLNTAIDADDGNEILRDRARKSLREWRERLSSMVREGVARGEVRRSVNPRELATLIIAVLEGALMACRLEDNREALRVAQSHLDDYIENTVRLRK